MPLSCAGTGNVERVRERFCSLWLRDCVGPDWSSQVLQRSEQQSEEKQRHGQRKRKIKKCASSLEKAVVFFYPNERNTKAGKTPRHHQEKIWVPLQHRWPPPGSERPSWWEVRHGATHPTVQVQFAGTHANHSFCFGLCGLIPFWVLVSYKLHNSKQSQPKPMCFAWFQVEITPFRTVFICNHKLAQVHSNLGLHLFRKKKSYNFFITADPNVWDCYRSPQTRS